MEIKLREKLLVEKCLNSIIRDYKNREDVNALIDLKLDFLSFLTSNEPEEIQYGIEYLRLQYEDVYILLGGMILEYQQNKLNGSLECKPIPRRDAIESIDMVVEIKETRWDKIKNWFKSLFTELTRTCYVMEEEEPSQPTPDHIHLDKGYTK